MRLPVTWDKLRPFLWPVALFYGTLVWWRNFFYRVGFFVSRRVAVPVVSVGNLTVGGTGKTPAVLFIAQYLIGLGYHPGIVSRGFGRKTSGTLLVSDGGEIKATVGDAGEEAYLLATRLQTVPVLVDEDRHRGASELIKSHNVDVLLLDDGFQHRGLARDCDLVLLDATAPPRDYHMFPYGALRDRLSALKRSSLVIWTRTEQIPPDPDLQKKVAAHAVIQIESQMQVAAELEVLSTGQKISVADLRGKPILAFCGIGRPQSFYQSLLGLGLEPTHVRYFPDHHHYSSADLDGLAKLSAETGAAMITTEKDGVKLPQDFLDRQLVYALRIDFAVTGENLKKLEEILLSQLPLPGLPATAGEA